MSACGHRNPLHCIIPPYVVDRLLASKDSAVRKSAARSLEIAAKARTSRSLMSIMPGFAAVALGKAGKRREIYDAQSGNFTSLPGKLLRSEGDPAHGDPAVNEAYNHSGTTYDFFFRRFARRSLDGNGMALVSSVHLGKKLNNAFWTGKQMAYGDGDGNIFTRFTRSLDVVAHELTHGIISHESNLDYQGQSGALNEHFSDVFGALVTQWKKKQSAAKAEWLIGKDIIGPGVTAKALRDMGPGLAYQNDPILGTDEQPKHMSGLYTGSEDEGGVHINSGIPNHAFYLFAKSVGGNAWMGPGEIWYEAMQKLSPTSQFADMVATTLMIAVARHGEDSVTHKALLKAWKDVGL